MKCIYVELPENKLQFIVYLNQCTLSSYVPTAYTGIFLKWLRITTISVITNHFQLENYMGMIKYETDVLTDEPWSSDALMWEKWGYIQTVGCYIEGWPTQVAVQCKAVVLYCRFKSCWQHGSFYLCVCSCIMKLKLVPKPHNCTIYHISWPIRHTVIFSLEILEKNNVECILILVIYWKKTGLLHTEISNHNIIYSS